VSEKELVFFFYSGKTKKNHHIRYQERLEFMFLKHYLIELVQFLKPSNL
jgi:hypothetical protein